MTTTAQKAAAVEIMQAMTDIDTAGPEATLARAEAALNGLDRDEVWGLKWWAEQFIAVVENKFESMPEE